MKQNSDWRTYVTDEGDSAGRKIDRIYARDKGYVIYFSGSEMFYEAEPDILKTLGSVDVELGRINSLLSAIPKRGNLQRKISLLELAADAYEAMFVPRLSLAWGMRQIDPWERGVAYRDKTWRKKREGPATEK